MPLRYTLSPEMENFVAKTRTFSVDSPDITVQRAAYSRMCGAFNPARPAGLTERSICMLVLTPIAIDPVTAAGDRS